MLFKFLSLSVLSLLLTTACSTPMKQEIDLAKLKPEERAYSGNIQVDLNGVKNDQLTCDLFLNSDINPVIRLSPDGNYQFKSIKKKLAFSKIACIHKVNNKKHWVYHSLELQRIPQPTEAQAKEIYNMGGIEIVWKIPDSEFESEPITVFESKDPVRDFGKLEVRPQAKEISPSPQI